MDSQPGIDHGARVVAHAAGADGVAGRLALAAGMVEETGIPGDLDAGQELSHEDTAERGRAGQQARKLEGRHRCRSVLIGRQVVGHDRRMDVGIRRRDPHMPSAFGTQLAGEDRDSRKLVKVLVDAVRRPWQEMKLGIGLGGLRQQPDEGAGKSGTGRQRSAPLKNVHRPGTPTALRQIGVVVQRETPPCLVDRAYSPVILQVLANARQISNERNTVAPQQHRRTDTRQLQ